MLIVTPRNSTQIHDGELFDEKVFQISLQKTSPPQSNTRFLSHLVIQTQLFLSLCAIFGGIQYICGKYLGGLHFLISLAFYLLSQNNKQAWCSSVKLQFVCRAIVKANLDPNSMLKTVASTGTIEFF